MYSSFLKFILLLCIFCIIISAAAYNADNGIFDDVDKFSYGSNDCPCYNPFNNYDTEEIILKFEDNSYRTINSSSYGAFCDNWEDFSNNSTNLKWCWVQEDKCERKIIESPVLNPSDQNESLLMSFGACGNIDSNHGGTKYRQLMAGKTLRAGYCSAHSYEVHFEGNKTDTPLGYLVQLYQAIAEDVGFVLEHRNITRDSLNLFSNSTFSACQHDLAMGALDVCIGPFWAIPYRIQATALTESYGEDKMYLVVPDDEQKRSFLSLMYTPLAPFTPRVWYLTFIYLIFMSAIIIVSSKAYDYKDRRVVNSERGLGEMIYASVINFALGVNAEVFMTERAHSSFQRLVIGGSVIFGLIMRSAYTSSLVNSLMSNTQPVFGKIQSLKDIINLDKNVCVEGIVAEFLKSNNLNLIGSKDHLIKPYDIGFSLLDESDLNRDGQIRKSKCDAIIMSESWFEYKRSTGEFCKSVMVGQPVLSIGLSIPIADEYARSLSYFTSQYIGNGTLAELRNKYEIKMLAVNDRQCNERKKDEQDALDIEELIFPITLGIVTSLVGLIWYLWDYKLRPYLLKRQDEYKEYIAETNNARSGINGDNFLRKRLNKMKPYELLEVLDMKKVLNYDDLDIAVNDLPNTKLLADIVFDQQCSVWAKNERFLENAPLSELIKFARASSLEPSRLQIALNDRVDPRRRLRDFLVGTKQVSVTEWRRKSVASKIEHQPSGLFVVNDDTRMRYFSAFPEISERSFGVQSERSFGVHNKTYSQSGNFFYNLSSRVVEEEDEETNNGYHVNGD